MTRSASRTRTARQNVVRLRITAVIGDWKGVPDPSLLQPPLQEGASSRSKRAIVLIAANRIGMRFSGPPGTG